VQPPAPTPQIGTQTVKLEPGELSEIDKLYDFQTLLEAIMQGQQGLSDLKRSQQQKQAQQTPQGAQIQPLFPFAMGGYVDDMTWEDIYRIIGRN
jgi:hypothetical protein